jgi:hypothetical protein
MTSQTSGTMSEWEYELLDMPVPPEVAAKADARRAEKEADEPAEFAALHQAGHAVDLTGVWESIRVSPAFYEYRGWELLDRLVAKVNHGRGKVVADRLRQALAEMCRSSDDRVYMEMNTPPGRVEVTAWCWEQPLPWRVEANLDVQVRNGRTRIASTEPVVLTTKNWGDGAITYTDSSGTLAGIVAGWLVGWRGRLGLRGDAGLVPDECGDLPSAPSVEEFAGDL